MAYVILTDRLEARTLADRQVVATLMAAGVPDLDMPDPDEVRDRFDELLTAEPKRVTLGQAEVAQALGVA